MKTIPRSSQRGSMIIALTLAAAILAGCSLLQGQPEEACTLIGCIDSLTVRLSGPIPDDFTMQLYPEDGATIIVRCVGGQNFEAQDPQVAVCQPDGVQFLVTPEQAHVIVTWEGQSLETDVTPDYTELQPNGPNCPPVCRNATVTIRLTP